MLPFIFVDDLPSRDFAESFCVRVNPFIKDKDELFKAIYYMLWFPGYFGFNWDALYDCLRDFDWIPLNEIVVVHESLPGLPRNELKLYIEILRDAVLDWGFDNKHTLKIFFKNNDRAAIEEILKI
ncbi:barstar family protein [Pseudomonas sp. KNUC1026]|uniref:barstar family protein n=1 Tax=Pseudomonas sp. KNUC1026 TaxID=2893890 RepID=UPI001F470A99|nr:barstar family protein [Pseudomonas sp. KNUC1026]UFH49281.1 barstar family protein [Pseudomonas sp. KNUC1026]